MKKQEVVQSLNQILQVRGISWDLLPESDLLRLFEAFQRLREEVEQVFMLFDEITGETPLIAVEDSKKDWRHYVV